MDRNLPPRAPDSEANINIKKHTVLFMSAIALCFGFFLPNVSAQETLLRTVSVTSEKGLSQTYNAFVVKDSYGWVWISSLDGLNLYNGTSVKLFRPNPEDTTRSIFGSNIQSSFFEDGRGNVWFTTESSLNCYSRTTGRFEHFFLDNGTHQPGTYTVHYAFFLEAKRYLWATAGGALFRFDTYDPHGQTSKKYLHPLWAGRCTIDSTLSGGAKRLINCFWDLGKGMEVIGYDGEQRIISQDTFFGANTLRSNWPVLTVRQSIVMSDSSVWAATNEGLLKLVGGITGRFEIYYPATGKNIRRVYKKSDFDLWVVSNDGFIYIFNTFTHSFKPSFGQSAQSDPGDALFVSKDAQNVLWRSIKGSGVFHNKVIKSPLFRQHLTGFKSSLKSITHIFELAPGRVACLNLKGEGELLHTSGQVLKNLSFLPYPKLSTYSDHRTWALSTDRLGLYDFKSNQLEEILRPPNTYFYDLVKDQRGNVITSTNKELLWVSSNGIDQKRMYGMSGGVLTLCLDKNNHLWTGNMDEKLQLWQYEGYKTSIKLYESVHLGQINHIVEDTLRSLTWVAMNKGLLKIWQEKDNTWRDSLLTERDGLPNQYIYAVVPDKKGNLWLSSNQGIIKYMPDQPIGQQFKQYTTRNGLSSNEYSPGAALMSSTGEIWFGSTHGVDVFHPDSVRDIGTAPQLAIVGLKIHDDEWHSDSVCIEMAQRIQLPYNQNTLRLELAAMEYTDPEMNRFRARLLNTEQLCANTTWWGRWKAWAFGGVAQPDTAWAELGTQNFITYANLRPGHYCFEFTACNAEGIWQKTPRQLVIIIAPPYWETWWFRSLVVGFVLGLVGFGTAFYYRYRLRVQQLELERQQREADRKQLLLEKELALQQERNRIADEMHDELGGGLATIRLSSERARKMESPDELKTILGRVSQISIGLISNMRGIIWAMDTQNDSLDSLFSYLRQYARTFLDDNAITANIQMPTEYPDLSLAGQYRHSILLTVKECLNNILKHADASAVWLHAAVDTELVIHIRDNGKGFDPEEKVGSGKGLRTTVKRMESINGSIEWIQNPEGGMTTVLRAPLTGEG